MLGIVEEKLFALMISIDSTYQNISIYPKLVSRGLVPKKCNHLYLKNLTTIKTAVGTKIVSFLETYQINQENGAGLLN